MNPVFPNGWYVLGSSEEFRELPVAPRRFFGHDVVLWRTSEGRLVVMGARCPHLGTDLAVGGRVVGDTLRCVMHGWRFGPAGDCVAVPYAAKPARRRILTWPVVERAGMVWLWWPPETEPGWEMPVIPEHGDPEWTALSNVGNRWIVRTRPQVIQENAADIHHLRELHGFPEPEIIELRPDGRIFRSEFSHKRTYEEAGAIEPLLVTTRIEIFGLGVSKQNSVAAGMVRSTTICTTTPIDADAVDLRMTSAVARLVDDETTRAVHETVLATTKATVEEDIPLWQSRDYSVTNFHSGDGGIASFQQWARQFYVPLGAAPRFEEG